MDPRLRTTLVALVACIGAVYLGVEVAHGNYFSPALAVIGITAMVLVQLTRIPADAIFIGFLLVGYLAGNRGFAQLMPAPGIPLLPAEAGLLVAVSWRLVLCAFERSTPFQRDFLNRAVLVLLALGGARLLFDLPRHGFLAARDFAMVYYAVFFFLVQHMARDEKARRYLLGCLLVGFLALGPLFALSGLFEDFFLSTLTIAGVPLIYFKGDLFATNLAAGSFVLFHWAPPRHRLWAWPAAVGMFLFVLSFDSRASLVGGLAASVFLVLARRWKFPLAQAFAGAGALGVVLFLAVTFNHTWANQRLHGLTDRLNSLVDLTGSGSYQSNESFNKGDNNRFRYVWWQNVIMETWDANPVLGLGFGADLSRGFVREYYPDAIEEFNARSPHNIFLTFFGRMGFLGLGAWLVFCCALLQKTWRALRSEDSTSWGLWCAAWVILVSATFGVVLEGPMGAVVFWSLIGLANARAVAVSAPATSRPPVAAVSPPAELSHA